MWLVSAVLLGSPAEACGRSTTGLIAYDTLAWPECADLSSPGDALDVDEDVVLEIDNRCDADLVIDGTRLAPGESGALVLGTWEDLPELVVLDYALDGVEGTLDLTLRDPVINRCPSSGCTTVPGSPSGAGLLMLGLALGWRRRTIGGHAADATMLRPPPAAMP